MKTSLFTKPLSADREHVLSLLTEAAFVEIYMGRQNSPAVGAMTQYLAEHTIGPILRQSQNRMLIVTGSIFLAETVLSAAGYFGITGTAITGCRKASGSRSI